MFTQEDEHYIQDGEAWLGRRGGGRRTLVVVVVVMEGRGACVGRGGAEHLEARGWARGRCALQGPDVALGSAVAARVRAAPHHGAIGGRRGKTQHPRQARQAAQGAVVARPELAIHPKVDKGIVAGVGHGQPVEQGPQVLDVGPAVDVVDLPHNLWEEGDTASLIMGCC